MIFLTETLIKINPEKEILKYYYGQNLYDLKNKVSQ